MLALLEADPSINWLQATLACWRMLLKAGWQGRNALTALCGGEALDPGLPSSLCPHPGGCGTATGRPRPPSGPW